MNLHRGCVHQEELGNMTPCDKCQIAALRRKVSELEDSDKASGVIARGFEQVWKEARAEVATLREERDALIDVLAFVEWRGAPAGGAPSCPVCYGTTNTEHRKDCQLRAVFDKVFRRLI